MKTFRVDPMTKEALAAMRERYQTATLLLASDATLARLRKEYEIAVAIYKSQNGIK